MSDRLFLEYFFEEELSKKNIKGDSAKALMHESSLLLSAINIYLEMNKKELSSAPISLVSPLLNDSGVMNLTKCNEYKGELWYNKERMQKTLLISTLAYALASNKSNADIELFASTLLEKEIKSEYKLNLFLSPKVN